jgi:hypothetical protein
MKAKLSTPQKHDAAGGEKSLKIIGLDGKNV